MWYTHPRIVEGQEVADILLDTGCSRALVRRDLVNEEKMLEGEAVKIRYAHGDTVLYPLACRSGHRNSQGDYTGNGWECC